MVGAGAVPFSEAPTRVDERARRPLPPLPARYPAVAPSRLPPRPAPLRAAHSIGIPVADAAPFRATPLRRPGYGMPNLRRNVCPHFYMTGPRGAIPVQAPHLLKALIRQERNTSRCQLRGGVHLEQGYVGDVCLSSRFNQCVFYEDELARD